MLQFYYDFLCKFLDPMVFQLLEMDTDSMYMVLTGKSVESMTKPELRAEFELEKNKPVVCGQQQELQACSRLRLRGARWSASRKSYFLAGKKNKYAQKGVQKSNTQLLCLESYKQALQGVVLQADNKGFRSKGNVRKDGLTPIYDKRLVLCDGVTTLPRVD